jgi:hypothetical protein
MFTRHIAASMIARQALLHSTIFPAPVIAMTRRIQTRITLPTTVAVRPWRLVSAMLNLIDEGSTSRINRGLLLGRYWRLGQPLRPVILLHTVRDIGWWNLSSIFIVQ